MDEKEIQETEVEYLALPDINEKEKINWKKKFKKISTELLMIFAVGILAGVITKTEAAKRFNLIDGNLYAKQSYDFVQIEKDLSAASAVNDAPSAVVGGNGGQ